MADAHSEKIGQLADRIDNLVHALQLPLPPAMHVQQLREALPQIRDVLRLIYTAKTGEDPWETHPRGVDVPLAPSTNHCGYCGQDMIPSSECLTSQRAGQCDMYQQHAATRKVEDGVSGTLNDQQEADHG